ncbi:MAG: hypothetical protein ACXVPN_10695 [Bacteroidia bacterium]
MKKKAILLSIILFPSLIYLFFEMTKANFRKMPYFGPKTLSEKGDTIYYRVPDTYFKTGVDTVTNREVDPEGNEIVTKVICSDSTLIDTTDYPVYLVFFLDSKLRKEGYKLTGIYDYVKFKQKDLKDIPFFVVSDYTAAVWKGNRKGDFDSLKINLPEFHPLLIDLHEREKFLAQTFFNQKPVYVFDYFVALIDKQRHIRGYYDPTYNAEVKRMIEDYKHLKIRDSYAETQKQNDIKQNEKN